MKVLLVNGSPNEKGTTSIALNEVQKTLLTENIETEIIWLGKKPIASCIACRNCAQTGKCIFNDTVNELLPRLQEFDGFVFGSPVHWAAANGALTSFMGRLFFAAALSGNPGFYLKPAAAVVAARRAGNTTAYDQINKYFGLMEMPVISSQYWNMIFGATADDAANDSEGLQTMRTLARNMSFFLKCKEMALKNNVALPEREPRVSTNFIR